MANFRDHTDAQLIDLLRQGDWKAFGAIYDRYFGLLYIFAQRKLRDEEDARDVLQELFAGLWEKRLTLNLTGELAPYLYTAVRNRILDRISHSQVRERYLHSLQRFADRGEFIADRQLREKELSVMIEREIDALPARMREIFLLSRRDHLSYREIAERLELSEHTVRSHIKHALRILRARLGLMGYAALLLKIFFK